MAASAAVIALVDALVDLFNKRSMDLPDGHFTRHTQFRLNGVPFENLVGRPAEDPLVLMLTRGAAGYRFTAKAIQHAVPDATLQRGELEETVNEGHTVVRGQCWLSGHYRGTGDPVELLVGVEMQLRGAEIAFANISIDSAQLQRLQQARISP